ncbi:MAG: hypothetical protein JWQ97_3735 [Phenylobacterium sp.]|nr:hypothetical protein [Phenylobacterium sp.]
MNRLKVTKDRTKDVLASIRALTKQQVLVGIPDENAERKPDPEDPKPLSNAAIGYLMETGSPAQNIPARPFLVPGVQNASETVTARYKAAAKLSLDGSTDAMQQAHMAVGLIAQSAVQAKITAGPFIPLSPRTLQARKARGRTGESPLIDTGQLRRAVTFVIRP